MSEEGAAGGDNTPVWTKGFDEDTMAYVGNKGWDGPSSMLESYRNLEKFSGGSKNLIEIPGEDADDDSRSAFFGKLGRPDDPTGYGFEMPDGGDSELFGWFQQAAHKHGLSNEQASAMFADWEEMSGNRMTSMEESLKEQGEKNITDLKREWGKDYDARISAGRQAAGQLGYDEKGLTALEEKMGTGEMLRLMANLGSKMGEDAFVGGERTGGGFGASPAQARQQIADLKLDKGFMDQYLAGDKNAVAKMTRLNGVAYG